MIINNKPETHYFYHTWENTKVSEIHILFKTLTPSTFLEKRIDKLLKKQKFSVIE